MIVDMIVDGLTIISLAMVNDVNGSYDSGISEQRGEPFVFVS